MAIDVRWYNEDERTIVHQIYHKGWTWEDFYVSRDATRDLIASQTHTVHILSDFSDSMNLPKGNVMMHAKNVLGVYGDNWGLLVALNNSYMIAAMVNMFVRVFPAPYGEKIRMASTIEEALDIYNTYQPDTMTP